MVLCGEYRHVTPRWLQTNPTLSLTLSLLPETF